MTRRKSERTVRTNERECPHIIELAMPPGGLGAKLDLIHAFHRQRGIDIQRGRSQRRDDQDYVRWCFATREDAEAFKVAFGGEVILPRP